MKKLAFTLTEILVVLSILGIVAAITIPATIKNTTERANITKIKKAMTKYEQIIENIKIENDISSIDKLTEWGQKNNCENISKYFKYIEQDGCKFRTSDKLWWDLSKTDKAIITTSQNKTDLDDNNAKNCENLKTFYLITSYDDNARAYRINDIEYEKNNSPHNTNYLNKLFGYINKSDNFVCQAGLYEYTDTAKEWLNKDYSKYHKLNGNETVLSGWNYVAEGDDIDIPLTSGWIMIEEGGSGTQKGSRSGWVINFGEYTCEASQSGWVINFGTYNIGENCGSSLVYNYGDIKNPHNKNVSLYENTGTVTK